MAAEPGGQRVGVTPMARRVVLRGPPANGGQGIGLAQRNFAGVAVQGLPGFGGSAGRGAAHQHQPTRSSSSLMRCDTAAG